MATAALTIDPRVAAEEERYGSLEAAIAALEIDNCGAPWGSEVSIRLNLCLAEQSARKAQAQRKAA